LFSNVNNTITITVAPKGFGGPGEATPVSNSFFDNGMDPALTARIGADENGNWVRFANFNPVTGQPQPWNYWTTVTVTPEPAMLSVLALGGLAMIRRRRK
jgi:MYXO-CTERM domain-containing protein